MTKEQIERVKKWVAALESGEYKQGQFYLHDAENQTYCCLGVACDLSGLGEWDDKTDYKSYGLNVWDWSDVALPFPVMKYYGLTHKQEAELISLNDNGSSFKEIAKVIREAYGLEPVA